MNSPCPILFNSLTIMFVCEFCFLTKQIREGVELVIRGRRLSVCCRWVWRDEGKEKKGCCCCCLITHNTHAHAHLPLCCCHERPYPSDQSVPLDNQRKKRLDKRERQKLKRRRDRIRERVERRRMMVVVVVLLQVIFILRWFLRGKKVKNKFEELRQKILGKLTF